MQDNTGPNNNIWPVHKNFSSVGSNSTHTSSYNPLASSDRAFQDFKVLGTTSTYTAPGSSGFQYVGGGSPLVVVTKASSEVAPTYDSFNKVVNITKTFNETVVETDFMFNGKKFFSEYEPVADGFVKLVTKNFDDTVVSTDDLAKENPYTENTPVADQFFKAITKSFSEVTVTSDTGMSFPFFDITGSMDVQVGLEMDFTSSMQIDIATTYDITSSMTVVITPTSLAAVTNASSTENPFAPTVISGGVTYVSSPCTALPPGYVVTPDTYYILYLNSGVGNTSFCDMTASNLTLDTQGGTFNISSQNPLGTGSAYTQNLAQTITAYGLLGTITDYGKSISQSENTYVSSGIFGSPNLNKPFTLVTFGGNNYLSFLSNQYGLNAAPPVNSFTTTSQMAQVIAGFCGITISWLVVDAPYHDIFGQSGLTGLDALNTLASQVGATVRWNGGTHYSVAYPDYYSGVWTLPVSTLLNGKFSYSWHEDLGYGVSGSGILGIPTNVYFDQAVKTIPSNAETSPQENIERICTVTKPFESDDPPIIVDLDNDIISVKIQILVPPGQEGGGRYVTENSSIWFDLGSPGISNPYVRVVQVGSASRNQLWVNYNLFPNLAAINNGKFSMNFGIVRRSLAPQYETAQQDAGLALRELQARIAANVRFIKTYTGTFSYTFFGSFPVPGMWASATYCGETVEGIVQSVNISGSGIVTVEVARFLRINFLDRKLNWALTSGNYGNV